MSHPSKNTHTHALFAATAMALSFSFSGDRHDDAICTTTDTESRREVTSPLERPFVTRRSVAETCYESGRGTITGHGDSFRDAHLRALGSRVVNKQASIPGRATPTDRPRGEDLVERRRKSYRQWRGDGDAFHRGKTRRCDALAATLAAKDSFFSASALRPLGPASVKGVPTAWR